MLSAILAGIKLLNLLFGYLDAESKRKVAEALVNASNMQADLKAINDANSARDAVDRDLSDHPDRVRAPDPDARKPGARSKPRRV